MVGGNLHDPICGDNKVLVCPAGTDFTPYDYIGKLNFISTNRDSFSPGICLELYTFYFFYLVFLCKHVLNYYLFPHRQVETIIWENSSW